LERIAFRRQCRQPLVRIKEPQLPHPGLRESSPSRARFAQVSGRSYFSRRPLVNNCLFSSMNSTECASATVFMNSMDASANDIVLPSLDVEKVISQGISALVVTTHN